MTVLFVVLCVCFVVGTYRQEGFRDATLMLLGIVTFIALVAWYNGAHG